MVKARDAELLDGNLRAFFLAFTLLATEVVKRDGDGTELEKLIRENRAYFDKRRPMLAYKDFLARGLLVGSGMVEGGIRFVGKDRLDRTGMQWGESGAEDILHLRGLHASERWDEFSLSQSRQRIARFQALKSTWLAAA